jgi:hypothetical protein
MSYIFVTMAIAGLLVKDALNLSGQRINILSLDIGELGGIERLGQRSSRTAGVVCGDNALLVHSAGLARLSGSVLRMHEANAEPG